MSTVFSYIVQKRLSQENENVATEALAYIVRSSARARRGLMNLLWGVEPGLPDLHFRTQLTDGDARPDMWGLDGVTPRAFLENKFWAGLTENQPVEYLKRLAGYGKPSVMLAVVPETRVETVWREFLRRLRDAKILSEPREQSAGLYRVESVSIDPSTGTPTSLAITSWDRLLAIIEAELAEEPDTRNDLAQLRSLCTAANDYAPFSGSALTDQRTPSLMIQLNTVVQRAIDVGVTQRLLGTAGLRPTHYWGASGRYLRFLTGRNVIAWFGVHCEFWRDYGSTPLWLFFTPGGGSRAREVQSELEPWAVREGLLCGTRDNGHFVLSVDVSTGEEPDDVVRSILEQLKQVASLLARLPEKNEATVPEVIEPLN